jgi:26S proteasome regulatory subunit T1
MADMEDDLLKEKNPRPLDEDDIALLKTYGLGPYSTLIKKTEKDIKEMAKKVNDLCGIKESDTGLAVPSQWDLVSDKQMMQEEQPLQVRLSLNTMPHSYTLIDCSALFSAGIMHRILPCEILLQ